jgi:hypothetical protein
VLASLFWVRVNLPNKARVIKELMLLAVPVLLPAAVATLRTAHRQFGVVPALHSAAAAPPSRLKAIFSDVRYC